MKRDIFGLSAKEMEELFLPLGLKKFRARQVFEWLHKKYVSSFYEMRNISRADQETLNGNFTILPAEVKTVREQHSKDTLTTKLLLKFPDGSLIETVLMKHDYGCSACVSSQVGCNMKCAFCASTEGGCARSLTAAEILVQVHLFNAMLKERKQSVSRVVVMGSGEPLLNYGNVMAALDFLHLKEGANISYRNMTISTCGIIPGMEKLMAEDKPINLALSLHAARPDLRNRIMPVNRKYPLAAAVAAAERYAELSGRQVTYEYILLKGVNDSDFDAELLSHLLKFKHASVNLIPANPVAGKDFSGSDAKTVERFEKVLKANGINATVRKEMGRDISAACGQLKADFIKEGK